MDKWEFNKLAAAISKRLRRSTEQRNTELLKAQQILDAPGHHNIQQQLEGWLIIAEYFRLQKNISQVEEAYQKIIELLQTFNDNDLLYWGYSSFDSALSDLQAHTKRIKYLGKQAEMWEQRGDLGKMFSSLDSLKYPGHYLGNYEELHYYQLITLQPGLGLVLKAQNLWHIGAKLSDSGDYTGAAEALEESLNCFNLADYYRGGWAEAVDHLIELYWFLGDEAALQKTIALLDSSTKIPWVLTRKHVPNAVVFKNNTLYLMETILHKNIDAELLSALQDESIGDRRAVAWTIGQTGNVKFIPALLTMCQKDNEEVQERAITALGVLGSRIETEEKKTEIVQFLVKMLYSSSLLVRWAAVIALRQIRPVNESSLHQALSADNLTVRQAAAIVLAKTRDATAISALAANLKAADWPVRVAAVEALGEIRDPTVVPGLLECLTDDELMIKWHTIVALGKIGHPQAVPALIDVLHSSEESNEVAAWALGEIGDEAAVPALIKGLSNPQSTKKVTEALTKIGSPSVPHILNALMDNPDELVQIQGKDSLIRIGDVSSIPKLRQVLLKEIKMAKHEQSPYYYTLKTMAEIDHQTTTKIISEELHHGNISKEIALEMFEIIQATDA